MGDRVVLMLDLGARTGVDIFRACAMGASSVLLGCAMVYALGAMGQPVVEKLLTLLEKELRTTMGLARKTGIEGIQRKDVYRSDGR